MLKWILISLLFGVASAVGYTAFLAHQKGYFSIPELPEGAYVISTKNGFRGIVLDAKVSQPIIDMPKFFRRLNFANPERRYLTIPFEVAPWFEDAWSICSSPSEELRDELLLSMPEGLRRSLFHARLDAVCRIDVDGVELERGMIFSVPKL